MPPLTGTPLILFGAFDRHNFGDLLLAHIAAARQSSRSRVFAGMAERDMRPWGGHRVRSIAALAREWGNRPAWLDRFQGLRRTWHQLAQGYDFHPG